MTTTPMTPGQRRTAKAIAARKRNAETRAADRLRARGWTCTPPQDKQETTDSKPSDRG